MLITTIGAVMIALLGSVAFGVSTPATAITGLVVYSLAGTVTFACLAFAATSITRTQSGAQGLSNGVGIILAMISGVFCAPDILPEAIRSIAQFLPLEPLANGYQSQYVTDASGVDLDARNLGILATWTLAALALAALRCADSAGNPNSSGDPGNHTPSASHPLPIRSRQEPPTNDAPTARATDRPVSGPTTGAERITSLDLIRGVAILGILPVNALVFGLADTAYFNVSPDGVEQPLDWIIGILTMVFVDQKMMALFPVLFGVGVVIFA